MSAVGRDDAAELRIALESDKLRVGLPERVLYSEAMRTTTTATMVFGDLVEDCWGDTRLYGADADEVLRILSEFPDEVTSLAVVGHNPTIHALSLELSGPMRTHPFSERYRPGELCVLRAKGATWAELGRGDFEIEASWTLSRP